MLKEGLLGGSLSTAWPLLHADRKAKIDYEGKKAINDKETIVLTYAPRGGSDLSIKLYFEEGTYRHVRSEYILVRAAAQGATVDTSAGQSGTIYRLVEDFSVFRKIGEMT
ncbi:MAG: hypothetical protein ABR535_04760 [Pyrinomonadaceae bacterium]